jgi:hypothetical protein
LTLQVAKNDYKRTEIAFPDLYAPPQANQVSGELRGNAELPAHIAKEFIAAVPIPG